MLQRSFTPSGGPVAKKRCLSWFATIFRRCAPLGLVTERPLIAMRAADGTIVEIFEWVSHDAITGALKNPAVLDLWKRFEKVCCYETPSSLAEFQNAHFEPI